MPAEDAGDTSTGNETSMASIKPASNAELSLPSQRDPSRDIPVRRYHWSQESKLDSRWRQVCCYHARAMSEGLAEWSPDAELLGNGMRERHTFFSTAVGNNVYFMPNCVGHSFNARTEDERTFPDVVLFQ